MSSKPASSPILIDWWFHGQDPSLARIGSTHLHIFILDAWHRCHCVIVDPVNFDFRLRMQVLVAPHLERLWLVHLYHVFKKVFVEHGLRWRVAKIADIFKLKTWLFVIEDKSPRRIELRISISLIVFRGLHAWLWKRNEISSRPIAMIAFASPIRTFSKAYAVVVYVFSFRISVVTVPVDPSNKLLLFFLQEELFQFKFLHLR